MMVAVARIELAYKTYEILVLPLYDTAILKFMATIFSN